MNLNQHFIEEILSVEKHELITEPDSELNIEMVKVRMLINRCGILIEHEKVFSLEEWTMAKEYGYYLG